MRLQDRIELLYASNQVDRDTYEKTPALLEQVASFTGVRLEEENAGAFTAHLMKAIDRIKKGEPVLQCSEVLAGEVKANKEAYELALGLLAPFNGHGVSLEAETVFVASYILSLTEEEEKE